MPNDDSPRVSLLRSRFTSLGSQWDDLRHVIICPSLGHKPQETESGFLRYRVHEAVWRATPYVTSLDFEPFPEHWFIIQGKLVAGCFFDAKKIRQDGDPTLPHNQEADRAKDVRHAIDEFNRLARQAADCFHLEPRRGQPPCANDPTDRWIEYLYEVIDPAEQYLPAPFRDRWWLKELPANVFLSSAEVLQRPNERGACSTTADEARGDEHSEPVNRTNEQPAPAKVISEPKPNATGEPADPSDKPFEVLDDNNHRLMFNPAGLTRWGPYGENEERDGLEEFPVYWDSVVLYRHANGCWTRVTQRFHYEAEALGPPEARRVDDRTAVALIVFHDGIPPDDLAHLARELIYPQTPPSDPATLDEHTSDASDDFDTFTESVLEKDATGREEANGEQIKADEQAKPTSTNTASTSLDDLNKWIDIVLRGGQKKLARKIMDGVTSIAALNDLGLLGTSKREYSSTKYQDRVRHINDKLKESRKPWKFVAVDNEAKIVEFDWVSKVP